jgi:hypothetical protein
MKIHYTIALATLAGAALGAAAVQGLHAHDLVASSKHDRAT